MSENNTEKKKDPQTNFDNEALQRLLKEAETKGKLEAEKSGMAHPQPSTFTNEKDHFLDQSFGLIRLEKFKEAIECFDKMLEIEPNNVKALAYKGFALSRLQKDNESMEFYNKALEIDPTNKEVIGYKVSLLKWDGKYKELLEFCDKMLPLDPNDETVLNYKSDALLGLGRFEEILESSEKILEIKPTNIEALHNKARALGGLGRIHDAIECLKKILEIEPNDQNLIVVKQFLNQESNIGTDKTMFEMMIYKMYEGIMNPTRFDPKKMLGGLFNKVDKKELFKMGVESFLNFSE